jgi:hypothetical protein
MDPAGACKSLQAAPRPSRRTSGCANSGDEGGRMSLFRRGDVRWYEFWFADGASKSRAKARPRLLREPRNKTVGVSGKEGSTTSPIFAVKRVRTFSDVADEFFNGRSGSDFRTAYLEAANSVFMGPVGWHSLLHTCRTWLEETGAPIFVSPIRIAVGLRTSVWTS